MVKGKFVAILLAHICIVSWASCSEKGNKNIVDFMKDKMASADRVIPLRQCQEEFSLKNGKVFWNSSNSPYSGSIVVMREINFFTERGEQREKEVPIAYFKFEEGRFVGEQIYADIDDSWDVNGFIQSEIRFEFQMKEGEDYIKLGTDYRGQEKASFGYYNFATEFMDYVTYYRILNRKNGDAYQKHKLKYFWTNGNVLFDGFLSFDWESALLRQDELHVNWKYPFELYHYNGRLAFEHGKGADMQESSGDLYFDFNGKEVDKEHFKMPLGPSFSSPIRTKVSTSFDLESYESFKRFFTRYLSGPN